MHFRSIKKLALLVVGSLFGLFGLYSSILSIELFPYWGNGDWPQVEGVVLPRSSNEADRRAIKDGIRYEYRVDGHNYIGTRVMAEEDVFYPEMHKQYPIGSRITVFYNPGNPRRAVLVPDLSKEVVMGLLLIGVLFTGIGVIAVRFGLRA